MHIKIYSMDNCLLNLNPPRDTLPREFFQRKFLLMHHYKVTPPLNCKRNKQLSHLRLTEKSNHFQTFLGEQALKTISIFQYEFLNV